MMTFFYNLLGLINAIISVVLYVRAIITNDTETFIAAVAFAGLSQAQWNAAEIREGQ